MPAKIDAPRGNLDSVSDAAFSISNAGGAISANFDLTAMSGYPQYGAQRTQLWVDPAGSGTGTIVLLDENGITHTLIVASYLELRIPIVTIVDSGSGNVNAMFEWFDGPGGSTYWNN